MKQARLSRICDELQWIKYKGNEWIDNKSLRTDSKVTSLHTFLIVIINYHHYISEYAILDQWDHPNQIKWQANLIYWPKSSFPALFCIHYSYHAYLINNAWPLTIAKCSETFCTIVFVFIGPINTTKLHIMAKNFIFD